MLPPKLAEQKIQELAQLAPSPELKNMTQRAIAGLTGLALSVAILEPASNIDPKYEPDSMMV